MPSTMSLARLVGLIATCDAAVAFFRPSFIGHMQNLDVNSDTFNRRIVEGFGIASSSIAITTMVSLQSGYEGNERSNARRAVGVGMAVQLILSSYFWAKHYVICVFAVLTLSLMLYLLAPTAVCSSALWREVTLSSGLVFFLLAAAHFSSPDLLQYSLGIKGGELSDKTVQHVRQALIYYIASTIQVVSLALGVGPEHAAGAVSLVWCFCLTYLWFVVKMHKVFEMSSALYHVNLTFPMWSGLLAAGILSR